MPERGDVRVAVQLRVQDLIPRAFVKRVSDEHPGLDRAWVHGPRLMFPNRGHEDHWEVALGGEPFLYAAERAITGPVLGLRVEGRAGLSRLAGLLDPSRADRLGRFLTAAARLDDDAMAGLSEMDPGDPDRPDRPLPGWGLPTNQLGAGALRGLIEAGLSLTAPHALLDPSRPGRSKAPALVLAEVHVAADETVNLRRTAARLVDLWRPLWGLPTPTAMTSKDELDRRLATAYRRSLRMLAGRRPPAERAALRLEVRELVRLYREAGRVRPRLLAILVARLKVE